MTDTLDSYFKSLNTWAEELRALRSIVLKCGLTEVQKWGQPCYMLGTKNILILHAFKGFCGIGFFQGALLQDEAKMLSKPGENSQSGRQLRFTKLGDIQAHSDLIKAYIFEAMEIEKAGIKMPQRQTEDLAVPIEFQEQLKKNKKMRLAFESLTPGRQRAYLMHFAAAKQSQTRVGRIERLIPRIIDGFGLTDCTCGLSKRMPGCDGSHRQLKEQA